MSTLTMAIDNTAMEPRMPPPSTITAKALMTATPHDKAMLLDVYDLLNKIFIRNINQHRRSHWWKSLHAFRKQLGLLLAEMETSKKTELEARIEARLRYWDDKFIHQWY
jgi:ribonuclease MRP protein subunit RMP1